MKVWSFVLLCVLGASVSFADDAQTPISPSAQPSSAPTTTRSTAPASSQAAKEEAPAWDVANPPGEKQEITIDADEGTWISLDVSPDGAEIIFDLLGDIYAIPIAGGDATALTTGMAWDMQPRYSPDGKSIAFISDRGGGDNLWIMDRAGRHPHAVSTEKFRLVSSPAWAPDGDFIAVRKHFTSQRALGAGEIWLYHRSGGEGRAKRSGEGGWREVHVRSTVRGDHLACAAFSSMARSIGMRMRSTFFSSTSSA